jgi:hypothetical protein
VELDCLHGPEGLLSSYSPNKILALYASMFMRFLLEHCGYVSSDSGSDSDLNPFGICKHFKEQTSSRIMYCTVYALYYCIPMVLKFKFSSCGAKFVVFFITLHTVIVLLTTYCMYSYCSTNLLQV